jgi:ABC-2 type transport system ATP-binding protein
MPSVSVSHVSKSFGTVQAVRDVSFSVEPGEIFGLLGPNGAGKTTTIRMMLDIFHPDSGEISILGGHLDEARKDRIGYMPEERGLYRDIKLEPMLIYLATLKGLTQSEARQRLDGWLKRLDLYDHRNKKVEQLSKGMQQKAQVIATLLHEPDLIIVDEPFAGLDPINTRLVQEIFEEQRAAGRAIIMSTHIMHQVEELCTRIALIDKGQTVLYGDVREIKRNAAGNAVRLEGQGEFGELDGVLESRRVNGGWQMTLAPGTGPQDILHQLVTRDTFRVQRFEIAEPSLDDIFVSVVQGKEGPHA